MSEVVAAGGSSLSISCSPVPDADLAPTQRLQGQGDKREFSRKSVLADKPKQRISVAFPPILSEWFTLNSEEALTDYGTLVQLRGDQVHDRPGCVGLGVNQCPDYLLPAAYESTGRGWV
jgi:hypothetical protein